MSPKGSGHGALIEPLSVPWGPIEEAAGDTSRRRHLGSWIFKENAWVHVIFKAICGPSSGKWNYLFIMTPPCSDGRTALI